MTLVLLTGGTGYIGGRLLPLLEERDVHLRCLCRHPERLKWRASKPTTEVVAGDVLSPESLKAALQGVRTAYYLVHSLGTRQDFEKEDRQAAANFGDSRPASRCSAHHLPGRPGRSAAGALGTPPQPPGDGRSLAGLWRAGDRTPSVDHHRLRQPVVRIDPGADGTTSGDDLSPLGCHAHTAHRHRGCAGIPTGRPRLAGLRKPHLRNRRPGHRLLRRHHAGIRPASGACGG